MWLGLAVLALIWANLSLWHSRTKLRQAVRVPESLSGSRAVADNSGSVTGQ
jgi:hypothetical protein